VERIRRLQDNGDTVRLAHIQLYIDPDICTDCGACEPECPVEAIFEEDDVPERWRDYIALNRNFFAG
jgi:NAD-dependent dihydropyrimidine dehydrogenase PreA subunit